VPENSPLKEVLKTGRLYNSFKSITLIGEGGFGKVFHAYLAGKPVAIKVVKLYVLKTENVVEDLYKHKAYREVLAMQRVQSENTVRFHSAWFEELSNRER
jgi:serine/threonine protein kinase